MRIWLGLLPFIGFGAQANVGRSLTSAAAPEMARPVFDGGLRFIPSFPVFGAASSGLPKLSPPSAPAAPAFAPLSPRKFSGGHVGLYPENAFDLTTGRRCASCNAPKEGTWYFQDEIIAVPKTGTPSLVWIGSSEMVEGAMLSDDGASITLKDGSVVPFLLVPKIETNRSYFNEASVAYLKGRPLRIRGEYVMKDGVRVFVGRTIWPEDYRIDFAALRPVPATTGEDVDAMVKANRGGARGAFSASLLWERGGNRDWGGKTVMGVMLNGAQGDDDEAHGGHFSLFTGRLGQNGEMADWMFDNFYDLDLVSEKGINAAMVPMDKYMNDLNSGQSWYRGTHMMVVVLKDERTALEIQERFRERYAKYYAHEIKYDRTNNSCTSLIVDVLREAGWNYPTKGPSPGIFRAALAAFAAVSSWDLNEGRKMLEVTSQDRSRLFPRAGFESVSGDLLSLVGAGPAPERELTAFETALRDDAEALVLVKLPQIPSSRKFGREPVASSEEYAVRIPLRRSEWETVPEMPRPFPPPLEP